MLPETIVFSIIKALKLLNLHGNSFPPGSILGIKYYKNKNAGFDEKDSLESRNITFKPI